MISLAHYSLSKMAAWLVQPFLHGQCHILPIACYIAPLHFCQKFAPFVEDLDPHLILCSLNPPKPHPNWHFCRIYRFFPTICGLRVSILTAYCSCRIFKTTAVSCSRYSLCPVWNNLFMILCIMLDYCSLSVSVANRQNVCVLLRPC